MLLQKRNKHCLRNVREIHVTFEGKKLPEESVYFFSSLF